MQMAFYLDQTRCTGCYTCVIACKDWHDVPAGPATWRRVLTIEKGKYPEPFVAFLSVSCYHCQEPACVSVCPVNAITKRSEDGIVVVDQDACLGKDRCGSCFDACPYDAPQFGSEEDAKVQKCNFCIGRLQIGKQPVCVAGCPMRALDAGSMEEMKAKYGLMQEAVGFSYDEKLRPSILFKCKPEMPTT